MSPNGDTRWAKTFGGRHSEVAKDIIETNDGSFVVGGHLDPRGDGPWKGLMMKVSPSGELHWRRSFNGEESTAGESISELSNGDLVLAGGTDTGNETRSQGWLLKTSSDGTKKQEGTFGGNWYNYFRTMVISPDGNLICGGYSYREGTPAAWVVKVRETTKVDWERSFSSKRKNDVQSLVGTEDSGVLIASKAFSRDDSNLDTLTLEIWLIKLDDKGKKQWSTTFGPSLNDRVSSVIQTRDGDYLIAGQVSVDAGNGESDYKFWLAKVGQEGEKKWGQTFGRNETNRARDLIETEDGDYVLSGTTSKHRQNGGIKRTSGLVVKLDVNDPPAADFVVSTDPVADQPTTLSAEPSTDPDGAIGAYRWDLTGDGSVDARGRTVEYTFPEPGEYPVGLTVADTQGKTASVEKTVAVAPTPTPSPTPTQTLTATEGAGPDNATGPPVDSPTVLGLGAGAATLAGALAWWRRKGD
jgi:PKD repeat protein